MLRTQFRILPLVITSKDLHFLQKIRKFISGVSISPEDFEKVAESYIEVVTPSGLTDERAEEIEEKIDLMQLEFVQYMEEMQKQLLLLRTTIDHMAQDLGEHGVKLDDITEKVDDISTKLDSVQKKLVEIGRKLTGNKLLMLALAAGVTTILLSAVLK